MYSCKFLKMALQEYVQFKSSTLKKFEKAEMNIFKTNSARTIDVPNSFHL